MIDHHRDQRGGLHHGRANVIQIAAAQQAARQRTPRLQRDAVEPAILDDALPAVRVGGRSLVEGNRRLGEAAVQQVHLELIGNQRIGQEVLQVLHGRAVLVGDTEIAHLALLFQASKGARHLLAFHQGIGAVQEQDVEVRGIEAPQDRIDRLDDVLVAEIEALRRAGRVVRPAYAHLRLQNHAVAQ